MTALKNLLLTKGFNDGKFLLTLLEFSCESLTKSTERVAHLFALLDTLISLFLEDFVKRKHLLQHHEHHTPIPSLPLQGKTEHRVTGRASQFWRGFLYLESQMCIKETQLLFQLLPMHSPIKDNDIPLYYGQTRKCCLLLHKSYHIIYCWWNRNTFNLLALKK